MVLFLNPFSSPITLAQMCYKTDRWGFISLSQECIQIFVQVWAKSPSSMLCLLFISRSNSRCGSSFIRLYERIGNWHKKDDPWVILRAFRLKTCLRSHACFHWSELDFAMGCSCQLSSLSRFPLLQPLPSQCRKQLRSIRCNFELIFSLRDLPLLIYFGIFFAPTA